MWKRCFRRGFQSLRGLGRGRGARWGRLRSPGGRGGCGSCLCAATASLWCRGCRNDRQLKRSAFAFRQSVSGRHHRRPHLMAAVRPSPGCAPSTARPPLVTLRIQMAASSSAAAKGLAISCTQQRRRVNIRQPCERHAEQGGAKRARTSVPSTGEMMLTDGPRHTINPRCRVLSVSLYGSLGSAAGGARAQARGSGGGGRAGGRAPRRYSTQSSSTRFTSASNPCSVPVTSLPPVNLTRTGCSILRQRARGCGSAGRLRRGACARGGSARRTTSGCRARHPSCPRPSPPSRRSGALPSSVKLEELQLQRR